ncbi:zf-CCHC domain-containing protein [Tanacetum coccineum]
MAQENYIEGCSMKRPPLLEANRFCFWKARFETYVMSKDIGLWQVIQNGGFYFEVEDSKTKMMKETLYEHLKDDQKKQLGKNNEVKMTLYNALPRKEYERVFMYKTAKEFPRPLKKKVKSSALKAKVTREQTSDDSDIQEGSDEDMDEEEAETFNLMAKNFRKFFHKGNQFGRGNRFGNGTNRFGRGHGNSFENKGDESSRQKRVCYNCGVDGHFASECKNPKENKAFVGGAWSDSEDDDGP